jgi:hypothetical protein
MGKGKLLYLLIPLVFGIILISTFFINNNNSTESNGIIGYNSLVIKEVIRANADSSICNPEIQNCVIERQADHNTLFTSGMNHIKSCLGAGTCTALTNITLCNATSTAASGLCGDTSAAATEAFTEFNTSSNLGRNQTSTMIWSNSTGGFAISRVYVSGNDNMTTNVTRIGNGSHYFAGNSFTGVTLQTNDQLNITWIIFSA